MIRSLNHLDARHQNTFAVSWVYNNVCNYSCSYCVPHLYNGSAKGPSLEVAVRFIDKVFEAKQGMEIFFELGGGEITYLPHFKELFGHIKSRGGHTGIISNGSRSVNWWQEHVKLIDHTCLTYHVDRADPEKFYQVVKALHGKTDLHLNLMMVPERFDEILALAERFASEFERLPVALQPIFDNFSGPMYPYSPEQKALLERPKLPAHSNLKHFLPPGTNFTTMRGAMVQTHTNGEKEIVDANNLITRQKNRWNKWDCAVGIESLVIEANGYIFRSNCGVEGAIGNIKDENFTFPQKPVICLLSRCSCAFDIMTTKNNIFGLPSLV